jgi:hypothetical protein
MIANDAKPVRSRRIAARAGGPTRAGAARAVADERCDTGRPTPPGPIEVNSLGPHPTRSGSCASLSSRSDDSLLEATPVRSPRTAARVVDGKALVVVIEHKQLHVLNAVGARIWELCDGRSVAAIADTVVAEFEVDASTALRDVQRFITDLRAVGALDVVRS